MDPLSQVPAWLPRPLPANALADAGLSTRIDQFAGGLPATLPDDPL